MAEHVTHTSSHDFTSGYLLTSLVPSTIPTGASLEIILTLTEGATPFDCASQTVTLYGRPLESAVSYIALGVATITGVGNNVLTIIVPKDTTPEGWALYQEIQLKVEGEGAGVELFKLYQNGLTFISDLDSSEIEYPISEDITVATETISAPETLDGAPGMRVIFLNGTTVTLPPTGTYEGQRLLIIAVGAASNVVNPNGVNINGVGTNQSLNQYEGLDIYEYDGNWVASNPSITVP